MNFNLFKNTFGTSNESRPSKEVVKKRAMLIPLVLIAALMGRFAPFDTTPLSLLFAAAAGIILGLTCNWTEKAIRKTKIGQAS